MLVFFQGKGRDIKRHFIELFSSRHEKIWISWDTSTIKEELLSVGKTKSYIRKLIRIYSASILNASIANINENIKYRLNQNLTYEHIGRMRYGRKGHK